MVSRDMRRRFCGHVLLGLPKSPLRTLLQLSRMGNTPHVFVHRCPLWLLLSPFVTVHVSAAQTHADPLLMELTDLVADNEEKTLTLIPCPPEAQRFVEQNRQTLETSFIISTDLIPSGGTV